MALLISRFSSMLSVCQWRGLIRRDGGVVWLKVAKKEHVLRWMDLLGTADGEHVPFISSLRGRCGHGALSLGESHSRNDEKHAT